MLLVLVRDLMTSMVFLLTSMELRFVALVLLEH
jgi:hypothetical protein